jgi:hypothetical protein
MENKVERSFQTDDVTAVNSVRQFIVDCGLVPGFSSVIYNRRYVLLLHGQGDG